MADRNQLTDQLGYLLAEFDALRSTIDLVPEDLMIDKPLGKWSIKEIFGHLIDCDKHIFLPRMQSIVSNDGPVFENVDQDELVRQHAWNKSTAEELFAGIAESRSATVEFVKALPDQAWERQGVWPDGVTRTLADIVHYITRHDAHHLRSIAYRLHESKLTSRPADLPK